MVFNNCSFFPIPAGICKPEMRPLQHEASQRLESVKADRKQARPLAKCYCGSGPPCYHVTMEVKRHWSHTEQAPSRTQEYEMVWEVDMT